MNVNSLVGPVCFAVLRIGVGSLFVVAGALKIAEPIAFLDSIRSFHLLRDPYAAALAVSLPWFEVFCGLALATGLMLRGGLLLTSGALLTFLAAILSAWKRGLSLVCGCFGTTDESSAYPDLIARDLLLLVACAVLLAYYRRRPAWGLLKEDRPVLA